MHYGMVDLTRSAIHEQELPRAPLLPSLSAAREVPLSEIFTFNVRGKPVEDEPLTSRLECLTFKDLKPGSFLAEAGLRLGDILISIGDEVINDHKDAVRMLNRLREQEPLSRTQIKVHRVNACELGFVDFLPEKDEYSKFIHLVQRVDQTIGGSGLRFISIETVSSIPVYGEHHQPRAHQRVRVWYNRLDPANTTDQVTEKLSKWKRQAEHRLQRMEAAECCSLL